MGQVWIGVGDDDVQAGHGEHLRDAAPHVTGTDHCDVLDLLGHVDDLPQCVIVQFGQRHARPLGVG